MERYSHLQALPNSPLTPLTPLSENTKFEFNFGGDGSLDVYINSVRQEHRVQQQQKKLLQHANRPFDKKRYSLLPKRFSEEFLKIRDIFEAHERIREIAQNKQRNQQHQEDIYKATPNASIVKLTHTEATPTPTKSKQLSGKNCVRGCATPKKVRAPLKAINLNVPQNLRAKPFKALQKNQQQQPQQTLKPNRVFRQASPIAAKPLCPHVANILQSCGLSEYCELFQKEEIDLYIFHLLDLKDLHNMGITNQEHCAKLLINIYCAGQYF